MSAFFEILKTFQIIMMIKTLLLSTTKVLFQGFGCKIETKLLTHFWTANSVKYENVIIGAVKCNTSILELQNRKTKVGKQGVHFLYLFKITKKKLSSGKTENLILSFSVIYRFIGLRSKITEICSINQKHHSN